MIEGKHTCSVGRNVVDEASVIVSWVGKRICLSRSLIHGIYIQRILAE